MKKFLALMFVCVGLTAMAAAPRVNTANMKVTDGKVQKAMVLKTPSMAQKMTAGVMSQGQSVQQFFAARNMTPADNKLMKKAPRRLGADEIIAPKIAFLEGYEYDEEAGDLVEAVQHFTGGWNVDMEQTGDDSFNAYLYFTGIPFQINVDYTAQTAEMVVEQLGGWHWIDTVPRGSYTYYYDTTEYIFLFDEAYMFNNDENAEPANIQGEIYDDGTIFFEDGWVVYDICYAQTTRVRNSNGQTTVTNDTTAGVITDFIHNTYLMTQNAEHSFTNHYSKDIVDQYVAQGYDASQFEPEDDVAPVYMFQYDDTTAVAWNVFGMGQRGRAIWIYEDGTMEMYDAVAYEASNGRDYSNISVGWDAEADTADWNVASAITLGTVTPTTISWGESCLYDFNSGYYLIAYFGNNKLTFTDPYDFWMLGVTAEPVITYVVNDDNVVISCTVEEGAAHLMYVDGEQVEDPYTIARGDEDKTVVVEVYAQVYGKQPSMAELEITIPALEGGMLGDVNNDGEVNITDVTVLISAVMAENFASINSDNADMNGDGTINITDVTMLINLVMSM